MLHHPGLTLFCAVQTRLLRPAFFNRIEFFAHTTIGEHREWSQKRAGQERARDTGSIRVARGSLLAKRRAGSSVSSPMITQLVSNGTMPHKRLEVYLVGCT